MPEIKINWIPASPTMDMTFSKTSKEKAKPGKVCLHLRYLFNVQTEQRKYSFMALKFILRKGRSSHNTVNKIASLYFYANSWLGQEYCTK